MQNDLIAAIATPYGKGGIAIIRLSGQRAEEVLSKVFIPQNKKPLKSHMLTYGRLNDNGQLLDECMAVVMRGPKSYTREDVCELHVHGGIAAAQTALELCLENGARLAQCGEFTRRAFENGRIDLSQAEAVMAMISAQGKLSQRAAMRELQGGASRFIRSAQETLFALMASLEAAVDYPEEVDEQEATQGLCQGLRALAQTLLSAIDEKAARMINQGLSVALCGTPNVGKSSLLNALLGEDKAIVTDIPGTTRDVLTGVLELNGIPVHLSDTAGLHESQDTVEKLGIERARKIMDDSDCVLLVLDGSRPLTAEETALLQGDYSQALFVFINKNDLTQCLDAKTIRPLNSNALVFVGSTLVPSTLAPLKEAIAALAGDTDALMLTNQRHLALAKKAADSLLAAADELENGLALDLSAVDLREALNALGEITGDQIEERVLDHVFSTFCVGK